MSLRIDRSAGIGSSRFMIYLPRKSNAHKRPVFPDWLFATVKRPRRMNCAGAGPSPAQTREAAFVSSGAARVEIGGLDLETTEEDREVGAAVCGYYVRIGGSGRDNRWSRWEHERRPTRNSRYFTVEKRTRNRFPCGNIGNANFGIHNQCRAIRSRTRMLLIRSHVRHDGGRDCLRARRREARAGCNGELAKKR